jgi:hypothetical protein
MVELDEKGPIHLTKSRINRALSTGIVVHSTELIIHPPPMCNLAVVHGSWNIKKGNRNGPDRAKYKD